MVWEALGGRSWMGGGLWNVFRFDGENIELGVLKAWKHYVFTEELSLKRKLCGT